MAEREGASARACSGCRATTSKRASGVRISRSQKRIYSPEFRHDINPNAFRLRMVTAKVNGVSRLEVLHLEGGNCDHFGLKLLQGRTQTAEILR